MNKSRLCLLTSFLLLPVVVALPTAQAVDDPCAGVWGLPTETTPQNTTLESRPMIVLRIHDFPRACSVDRYTMSIDGYLVEAHQQWSRGALMISFWHKDQDVAPGQHAVKVRLFHEDRLVRSVEWGFGYLVPGYDSPLHHDDWRGVGHAFTPQPVAGHTVYSEEQVQAQGHVTVNAYAPAWMRPHEEVLSASLRVERTHFVVIDGQRHDLPPLGAELGHRVDMPCGSYYCDDLLP